MMSTDQDIGNDLRRPLLLFYRGRNIILQAQREGHAQTHRELGYVQEGSKCE